ncbi:hypothetical protein IRT45_27600 [Nocardia sp. BSTN01]|uniref:hypothetical protein n=1 Tax=Nocardia sp. BSTN01 TaxID=2783665 RepID=UPI00188E5A4B|nr:hypothetical protein [Nocardia sp. BSTN01]MBF5000909.1 hypothetical protein [Nocardia sp. BSTN01]
MIVEMCEKASPGSNLLVKSAGHLWHGTWRGNQPSSPGSLCDIEVSIDDIHGWQVAISGDDKPLGIYEDQDGLQITGRVTVAYEDGLIALDIGSGGNVLIDPDDHATEVKIGEIVTFKPGRVDIFPTNI